MEWDEEEAMFEAARDHAEGVCDGWWYASCPSCAARPGSDVIMVRCYGGCNTSAPHTVEQISSMGEDEEYVCFECKTGITAIRKCHDCEVVLAQEDQFDRCVVQASMLMIFIDHQTVCFKCYLDNPGEL